MGRGPKRSVSVEDLKPVVLGLMVSDNLGDVHDEINVLRGLMGLPKLQGSYYYGWQDDDWDGIEQ